MLIPSTLMIGIVVIHLESMLRRVMASVLRVFEVFRAGRRVEHPAVSRDAAEPAGYAFDEV